MTHPMLQDPKFRAWHESAGRIVVNAARPTPAPTATADLMARIEQRLEQLAAGLGLATNADLVDSGWEPYDLSEPFTQPDPFAVNVAAIETHNYLMALNSNQFGPDGGGWEDYEIESALPTPTTHGLVVASVGDSGWVEYE